jgi:hypothetical protein
MSTAYSYASLAQLKARQGLSGGDTTDDQRLLGKLFNATEIIENECAREFIPKKATISFDYLGPLYLYFRGLTLLQYISIVDGRSVTIDPAAVVPLGSAAGNVTASDSVGPWFGVELDPVKAFFLYQTTRRRCMQVTGIWGYHDDYNRAWIASNISFPNAIPDGTTAALTISANPDTTADAYGRVPALSAGQLISVDTGNNQEWMIVTKTTTSQLTVVRGERGTAGIVHNSGLAISIYEPPKDIQEATLRLAAYLFAQDSTDLGKTVYDAAGTKTVPAHWPPDIKDILDNYRATRVA